MKIIGTGSALPEQIVAHFYDIPYGHFAVLPPPQRLMYV